MSAKQKHLKRYQLNSKIKKKNYFVFIQVLDYCSFILYDVKKIHLFLLILFTKYPQSTLELLSFLNI